LDVGFDSTGGGALVLFVPLPEEEGLLGTEGLLKPPNLMPFTEGLLSSLGLGIH